MFGGLLGGLFSGLGGITDMVSGALGKGVSTLGGLSGRPGANPMQALGDNPRAPTSYIGYRHRNPGGSPMPNMSPMQKMGERPDGAMSGMQGRNFMQMPMTDMLQDNNNLADKMQQSKPAAANFMQGMQGRSPLQNFPGQDNLSSDVPQYSLNPEMFPRANENYLDVLNNRTEVLSKYGINTTERQAQFFAQLAHESDGFATTTEYSSGKQYEGRKDLGNLQPGDGERFKGRGFIQLTGRSNYAHYGKKLGLDLVNNPELAAQPEIALEVAAAFWKDHGLNALADKGDIKGITKRINGGYNGLQDRMRYYNMFRR